MSPMGQYLLIVGKIYLHAQELALKGAFIRKRWMKTKTIALNRTKNLLLRLLKKISGWARSFEFL